MDDLDDVSKALNESLIIGSESFGSACPARLTFTAEDGSSFQTVVETSLTLSDVRTRQATVEALHEILTTGTSEHQVRQNH